MELNQRLHRLMCKESEGVYKKYLENNLGLNVCAGKLKDTEIADLGTNIDLLRYLSKTKQKCCDFNKLIEVLT